MATAQEFRRLVLSASEIKQATGWGDAMVEDYLNILNDLITLANAIDGNDTDITDLENRVTALEGRVTTLEINVAALGIRVTQNEANIAQNQTDIAANSQRIKTNEVLLWLSI